MIRGSNLQINIKKTDIRDLLVVEHEVFQDKRGFFFEAYRKDLFEQQGLPGEFVQLNHSGSERNVIRGLHFQWDPPMSKLMRVVKGTAFLVAVDIRRGSPTLGKWFGIKASAENKIALWAPASFARGFCVISDYAEIQYLCTGIYNRAGESGVLWRDPEIGIGWPVKEAMLSEKDESAQTLSDWLKREESNYFVYEEK